MALQPDGKVLLGWTSVNLSPNPDYWTSDLARLNADGSQDFSFNPIHGINVRLGSICIALQPDGKALIGGDFKSLNSVDINGITRIDGGGNLDFSFNAD